MDARTKPRGWSAQNGGFSKDISPPKCTKKISGFRNHIYIYIVTFKNQELGRTCGLICSDRWFIDLGDVRNLTDLRRNGRNVKRHVLMKPKRWPRLDTIADTKSCIFLRSYSSGGWPGGGFKHFLLVVSNIWFFIFTPIFGEMIQFDYLIFSRPLDVFQNYRENSISPHWMEVVSVLTFDLIPFFVKKL